MCLIAHVPAGRALTREDFDSAHSANSDGIGVMSADGVEKFYGKKMLKRARRYAAWLASHNVEHAVHWRYATHGAKGLALTHPFELPEGAGYLMHNGILHQTAARATAHDSDTSLFVRELSGVPRKRASRALYWDAVGRAIGTSNKFCVMHADGHFTIVNREAGVTESGIWYSNTYSLARHSKWDDSYTVGSYATKPSWFTNVAAKLAAYDRVSDYGPREAREVAYPSGPTLDADEIEHIMNDETSELWACRHGTPWSDFCEVCDGDKLPGWGEVRARE